MADAVSRGTGGNGDIGPETIIVRVAIRDQCVHPITATALEQYHQEVLPVAAWASLIFAENGLPESAASPPQVETVRFSESVFCS